MYFASNPSGNANLTITLTVKDARGSTEVKVLNVNVKGEVDLKIRADGAQAPCGGWGINQDILFGPDIRPSRLIFDYPTDYFWDFGDGERDEDRHDGLPLDFKAPDGTLVQTIYGADMSGVPAQGNENPTAHFDDHVLYQYQNQYYDPSYGTGPFPDKASWVLGSLAGYGTLLTYVDPSLIPRRVIWLNQSASQSNTNVIKFK